MPVILGNELKKAKPPAGRGLGGNEADGEGSGAAPRHRSAQTLCGTLADFARETTYVALLCAGAAPTDRKK
jgi:hypothetical protein